MRADWAVLRTVQWHPKKKLAVVHQTMTVEAFEDAMADPVFEAQVWRGMDIELLKLCDEVRADRFSWTTIMEASWPPEIAEPPNYHDLQFLGGPLGGSMREEFTYDGQRLFVEVDLSLPVMEYDNLAEGYVIAPIATYDIKRIAGRSFACYVPEPRR